MKIGVLGLGKAGRRHYDNAKELGHEVDGFDPDPVIPQNDDRKSVIDWADAVVIASPAKQHWQDIRDCSKAGKPMLVEKPLIMPGQPIMPLAPSTLPKLAVGYNLRFHPLVDEAKGLRDVYHAHFSCCQHSTSPGPCLVTWACHEIDLALYLMGDLRMIDMHIDDKQIDLFLVNWDTGSRATVHSDMIAARWSRYFHLVSETDSYFADLERNPVSNDHYRDELKAFLTWVQGDGRDPRLAGVEDGLKVLEIQQRAVSPTFES